MSQQGFLYHAAGQLLNGILERQDSRQHAIPGIEKDLFVGRKSIANNRLETTILPSGINHITFVGRLDIEGVTKVEDKFAFSVMTESVPVLVDLSQVGFIASIGIRMLLMSAKALNRCGGRLVLYKPQPLVGEALATAGIDMLIPVYDDFDAACASLLQTPPAAV